MSKTSLTVMNASLPTRDEALTWQQDNELQSFLTAVYERPGEVRGKVPQRIVNALPGLIAFEQARWAPMPKDPLLDRLTALLALVGGAMKEAERAEWQAVAAMTLQEIPGELTVEALDQAMRACTHASQVIPFVFNYVEDYPIKRRRRLEALLLLADAANL